MMFNILSALDVFTHHWITSNMYTGDAIAQFSLSTFVNTFCKFYEAECMLRGINHFNII
jgi:hypothetical protein